MGIEGSQAQAGHIKFRRSACAGAGFGGWARPEKYGKVLNFSGFSQSIAGLPGLPAGSRRPRRGPGARRPLPYTGSRNIAAATRVGARAHRKRRPEEMLPSGKWFFRMAKPAGFGALAITVRPPPVTAPATSM